MTPELITAVGWSAAALFAALHVRTRQRLVVIARATHELRGPLSAARLGLGTITAEPGRVAAIDLELARAGRALEDLTAAPSGARRPDHVERVDLIALTRAYAPAWSTLAAAHGAGLRLEVAEPARHLHAVPAPPDEAARDDAPRTLGGGGPPSGGRPRVAGVAGTPSPWPDPMPPSHRWTWRPADVAVVLADPFRVAQAVANLVANAAEHGGGLVRLRVTGAGERVRIEVTDDGPGLPAPVPALVASARTRRGRRGHGLAIAGAIAEQLGGRLTAMPAASGARLVLDLPAAP